MSSSSQFAEPPDLPESCGSHIQPFFIVFVTLFLTFAMHRFDIRALEVTCITSPICWLLRPRMRPTALHHFQYPSVGEPAEAEN